MSDKTIESYKRAFAILKENGCITKYTIVDFEQATINAYYTSFDNVVVFGCIFHLGQAVWRKIQILVIKAIQDKFRF